MEDTRNRFEFIFLVLFPVFISMGLGLWPRQQVVQRALHFARLAEENNRPAQIVSNYSKVVSIEPWRIALWPVIANAEMAAGNWVSAVSAFETAKDQGVLSTEDEITLGEAYRRNDQNVEAVKTWQAVMQKGAAPPDVYRKTVELQRRLGDYPGTIETLKKWMLLQPDESQVSFQFGLLLAALRPDESLPVLTDLRKTDSTLTAQIDLLLLAIRDNHDESIRRVNIGRALANLGYWDLAALSFRAATEIKPGYAEAWAFLGEALQHTGLGGWKELKHAADLSPDSIVGQALMALHYRRQGDPETALDYLNKIASAEPGQAIWQVEIGNTLAQKGDLPAALGYYRHAVELEPGSPVYWELLASYCVDNNIEVRETGLPAARRALMLSPDKPASLEVLGWTFFRLGDLYSAERFLKRSVDEDESRASASLRLGQLYLENGEMDRAKQYISKAAHLADDSSEVHILANRLLDRFFGEGQ